MPPSDPDLLAAFVAGRPGARDALLDRWLPEVLQWCARLGGPRVDPEDAAQDVVVVLITRVADLRDPARFPSWLFGVTRRVLAAHRRRAWLRRWVPGASTYDAPDPDAGAEHRLEADQTGRRVLRLLEELPAAQREALVLCDLEDRSAAEAAELLDVPVGTVKSRLRLGRERFRALCRAHDIGPLAIAEESP
jgi:RNA polymerase sigma-70 factor (ECF subfamily)